MSSVASGKSSWNCWGCLFLEKCILTWRIFKLSYSVQPLDLDLPTIWSSSTPLFVFYIWRQPLWHSYWIFCIKRRGWSTTGSHHIPGEFIFHLTDAHVCVLITNYMYRLFQGGIFSPKFSRNSQDLTVYLFQIKKKKKLLLPAFALKNPKRKKCDLLQRSLSFLN